VLTYLRQNTLAFIALCVALFSLGGATAYAVNTVRSTDIVDGQVLTQDLGNNAVTTGKIKDGQVTNPDIAANSIGSGKILDNNVTGADINEATLGQVPNAANLGSLPAGDYKTYTVSSTALTSSCSDANFWSECAGLSVTVPSGHVYSVTVLSTVTANPGPTGMSAFFCPSYDGPTCVDGSSGDGATFVANQFTNVASMAYRNFGAGTYLFNTGLKVFGDLPARTDAHTMTTIIVRDRDATLNVG
jgi:hypothetical protein